jgi:hypothetical protein
MVTIANHPLIQSIDWDKIKTAAQTPRGRLRAYLRSHRMRCYAHYPLSHTDNVGAAPACPRHDRKRWERERYERRAACCCQRLGLWPRDEAEAYARELTLADPSADAIRHLDHADAEARARALGHDRIALAVAAIYDLTIHSLTRSSRATIRYGAGGVEQKDWPYRGSFKSYPAVWHDAGARIDYSAGEIVIENSGGREVCRVPLADVQVADGRLHCESGPALRMGGVIYYILHGVRLTTDKHAAIVSRDAEACRAIVERPRNAEVARVALEYVPELAADAQIIDTSAEHHAELVQTAGGRMLRVHDASTDRVYLLPVPRNQATAAAALAWSFGLAAGAYQPAVES